MPWLLAVLAYVAGCNVGHRYGYRAGRAAADAEWALWAEHGAAPVPDWEKAAL